MDILFKDFMIPEICLDVYKRQDLDLAQEVCDNLGWELVKKPINWDSKDMELNSGSIDCIWNGFTINGREDDYTWSDPYLNNEQVMVVAADSGIEKLDDLAGKNVVVQAASAALDALKDVYKRQPLSREVFWHEYAKIPRHTSQNSIAAGNLE